MPLRRPYVVILHWPFRSEAAVSRDPATWSYALSVPLIRVDNMVYSVCAEAQTGDNHLPTP